MSDEDPIKAAEKRGYAKGYQAGIRRIEREDAERERRRRKEEFRQQAFLSALPSCIIAQNWTKGEKPITSKEDRAALAWRFADEALKGTWF